MKPMIIALALALGALAATVFMRIANGAEPCQVAEDDLEAADIEIASEMQLISNSPTARPIQFAVYQPDNGLMDPFADAAPAAAVPVAPTAPSAAAPDPTADPGAFATAIIAAAKAGKWLALFGLVLVGLIALARWALTKHWSWFGTDKGGAVTALAVTFLTTVSGSMVSGIFDWTVIMPAAATFLAGAVAIYVLHKKAKSQS